MFKELRKKFGFTKEMMNVAVILTLIIIVLFTVVASIVPKINIGVVAKRNKLEREFNRLKIESRTIERDFVAHSNGMVFIHMLAFASDPEVRDGIVPYSGGDYYSFFDLQRKVANSGDLFIRSSNDFDDLMKKNFGYWAINSKFYSKQALDKEISDIISSGDDIMFVKGGAKYLINYKKLDNKHLLHNFILITLIMLVIIFINMFLFYMMFKDKINNKIEKEIEEDDINIKDVVKDKVKGVKEKVSEVKDNLDFVKVNIEITKNKKQSEEKLDDDNKQKAKNEVNKELDEIEEVKEKVRKLKQMRRLKKYK